MIPARPTDALLFAVWAVVCATAGAAWLSRYAPPPPPDVPADPVIAAEAPDARDAGPDRPSGYLRAHPVENSVENSVESRVEGGAGGEGTGVVAHDRARAWQGLNLYTSAHAPEAVLMDMDGAVVHTWTLRGADQLFQGTVPARNRSLKMLRRARLLPDGGLVAIVEGVGTVALDRDSNVRWALANRAHHDLEVSPDGRVWVLTRVLRDFDVVSRTRAITDEHLVQIEPDGRVARKISLLDLYQRSSFEHWRPDGTEHGDLLQAAAIEVLDGSQVGLNPAFAEGNLLVALRRHEVLAVVDPRQGQLLWSQKGPWTRTSDVHLLPTGRLLVLDNPRGDGAGGPSGATTPPEVAPPSETPPSEPPGEEGAGSRGGRNSRLVEIDAASLEVVWTYDSSEPLLAMVSGAAQRLPNGDTLVTEANGRAFEIAPDGAVVWEFRSPHRAEGDPELVAQLFEVQRVDAAAWDGPPAAGAPE